MKVSKRYRIRLRRRPWRLGACVVGAFAILVYALVDPLDGIVTGDSRFGDAHYTWAHQRGEFVMTALWHLAAAIIVTALSILAVYGEWNRDYLPPRKDAIDDPNFTQPG